MPLIDLKTDLKSLKYGKDRPGGDNSGQPYIETDINKIDTGFNRFRMTKFDDGLIRGGAVGALNASVVDTIRIGKFLTDLPKGPLFIAKQVGLQLSNPQLESKKLRTDNPTSGGGLLRNVGNFILNTANKLVNAVGPTRIYNLGINTLAQVPVNAFGVHLNRHGLLPVQNEDTKYINVAEYNNYGDGRNNRLVGYKNKFQLGDNTPTPTQNRNVINTFNNILQAVGALTRTPLAPIKTNPQQLTINSYISGPNSVYGIGNTTIRRYSFTEDGTKINFAKTRNYVSQTVPRIKINQTFDFGVSNFTQSSLNPSRFDLKQETNIISSSFQNYIASKDDINTKDSIKWNGSLTAGNDLGLSKISGSNLPTDSNNIVTSLSQNSVVYSNPIAKKYSELQSQIEKQKTSNQFGIYGDLTSINKNNNETSSLNNNTNFLPSSTSNPVYFNGYSTVTVNIPWNEATREKRVGSGKRDSINLTPIFSAGAGTIGDVPPITIPGTNVQTINDLVKFRIQALNGDNPSQARWMVFRAYITQFSDNTDASWNSFKYTGRGEDFYIYGGFSRKIQIGFKVAALSAEEMEPMYQKLNFLMGNIMPDYNNDGLMRGPMVKMTVGNWIDGQDGILNSVGYTIPNDSPWEIAINEPTGDKRQLVLPHIVEVSMAFTPIGSQTKSINLVSSKSETTSHIAQNQNDYQFIK